LKAKLRALGSENDPRAILRNANLDEISATRSFTLPGGAPFNADGANTPYTMRTWGAIFVEVGVDPELGAGALAPRLPRRPHHESQDSAQPDDCALI
jgi:xanthine dehydrogenase YagR molybdenum-binding subunit